MLEGWKRNEKTRKRGGKDRMNKTFYEVMTEINWKINEWNKSRERVGKKGRKGTLVDEVQITKEREENERN